MGDLKIIATTGGMDLSKRVDAILQEWHKQDETFIINSSNPRFADGEAKGVLEESIRGKDLYFFVDVVNYSVTYKFFGMNHPMSPDDHYQDLKRMITACNGKAKSMTVIMPFLYEGRQHKRSARESLDCAIMLQELVALGVDNIITIDAHDPRVQNAIPHHGFENMLPILQFVETFLSRHPDFPITADNLVIISPDEGATSRAVKLATTLKVGMGMFYKDRDYTKVVNGRNPIKTHEYVGPDIEGKTAIIVDDMISTGESMLDVCKQLKERGVKDIYIFSTFGLFVEGMEAFDKAWQEGLFAGIYTTNSIYQSYEMLSRGYYVSVNMDEYIAAIVDTLNKNTSISELINPTKRCQALVEKHQKNLN